MRTSTLSSRLVRREVGLATLGVLLAAAGWWWQAHARHPIVGPGALRGANVLLVTIDTLRTDRIGAYGGGPLTPVLDRLAARGVRFTRAYAHAPMTLPSHASILTGLLPPGHGVRNNGAFRLDPSTPTLAGRLRAAGYRTGAFVGAFVLDRRFGLSQGFDVYDDLYRESRNRSDFSFDERRAPDVLQPATDWILARRDRPEARVGDQPGSGPAPWFAWVHLFDPHAPYEAPPNRGDGPYDAEVAFTDDALGPFFDRLGQGGQLERTLIIVTADHGESLGDHGEATHGLFAYDSTLKVPLLIAGPGVRPAVRDDPVAHVDLVPTVLDLLGIDVPATLAGRSLRPALNGTPVGGRAIYFEALDANLTRGWAPLTGVIQGGFKYIDLPIAELYDLASDPTETTNLAPSRPRERVALAATLNTLRDGPTPGRPASAGPVDVETESRLRALGYTAAATPGASRAGGYGVQDDPKQLVALNDQYIGALARAASGALDEAVSGLHEVITQRPDFTAAYTNAASILIQAGRPSEAVTLLRLARDRGLASPQLADRLGAAALAAGDLTTALTSLEPVAATPSASLDSLNTLGVVYAELGRSDDARRLFDRVTAVDPKSPGTWNNVGLLDLRSGRTAEAASAFRRALAADPEYAAAWQGLGAALVDDDRPGAIEAWIRAVELLPDDYDTLFNVAVLLAGSSAPERALPYLRRFAASAPPSRYAPDLARVHELIAALERH